MKYKILFYLSGAAIVGMQLLLIAAIFWFLQVPKGVGLWRLMAAGVCLGLFIKGDDLFDYWNKLRRMK